MNFKKALTPKDTEEVKPGLFIQTKYINNDGIKEPIEYRKILPLCWNDKWFIKEQLKTIFSLRTFLTIAIFLFLAWSYLNDVKEYKDFYYEINADPIGFCSEVNNLINTELCTENNEGMGLCTPKIRYSNISDIDIIKFEP